MDAIVRDNSGVQGCPAQEPTSSIFLKPEQIQLDRMESVLHHPKAQRQTGNILNLGDRVAIDAEVDTLQIGVAGVAGGKFDMRNLVALVDGQFLFV